MDLQQINLIRESWAKASPVADVVIKLFYNKLFELDPSLKAMFNNDMAKQRKALTATLNTIVNNLDKLDTIIPVAQNLGKRHVGYGVKDKHYDTVATALLWAFEHSLGDEFTPQTKQAWTLAYTTLATVMKEAAAEVQPVTKTTSTVFGDKLKGFLSGGLKRKVA